MAECERSVLLVDDSKTFQSIFHGALDGSGCRLFVCNDGAEALELIGSRYIDFVCSSFYLRDMEGIELCRRVRALTRYACKPFVLLTSVETEGALVEALPAGVTDIFRKNDVEQLLAFVKRFPSFGDQVHAKVLYVEDSPAQRALLVSQLVRHGLTVDACASGDEAWARFEANDYDLVLTDIVLDGTMSGLAFINRIRRLPGDKGDTPVLAVTAFDDKTRRIELFNLGVTDYIVKPVIEEELLVRIRGVMTMRKLMAQIELDRVCRQLEAVVAARTQELEEANRELQSFSYSVSHDLRAPLRAIAGYCRIIADTEAERLSTEGHHLFERVETNAKRMAELIDDILEYSRSGNRPIESVRVDLGELAREAAAALGAEHPRARIEVGALPAVDADRTMLTQIFQNLIGNALKFSARREAPQVTVGVLDREDEKIYFVRDNGAGFDMRYAGKLFGLFQRMHRENEFPGTGVGLAICKRLVGRLGGRLWAESRPDEGATFFFTLSDRG